MKRTTVVLLTSYLVLLGALVAFLTLRGRHPDSRLLWDDDVRREVQAIVEYRYVDPLDEVREQELFDSAMRGYVGELDPFSRYFSADERPDLDRETRGAFGGIGVLVRGDARGFRVTGVRRGGPASEAGIVPGVIVTQAAGIELAGLDLDEMLTHVKGDPDTDVVLRVEFPDEPTPRDLTVTRAVVPLDVVPAVRLVPGEPPVAYLRLTQFSETTVPRVREALQSLVVEQGAEAVVLDLRQNLGGLVQAAVDVASFFVPPDTVVCRTHGRSESHTYSTRRDSELAPLDLPLVVLTDDGTASASEILAGALQDHGRAVLVGGRSYGKFLVQSLIELDRGEGLVRVTTSRYVTPEGRSAQLDPTREQSGGLLPDVRVELGDDERRQLFERFARQAGPDWELQAGREVDDDGSDPQLDAALALIRGAPAPLERVAVAGLAR